MKLVLSDSLFFDVKLKFVSVSSNLRERESSQGEAKHAKRMATEGARETIRDSERGTLCTAVRCAALHM